MPYDDRSWMIKYPMCIAVRRDVRTHTQVHTHNTHDERTFRAPASCGGATQYILETEHDHPPFPLRPLPQLQGSLPRILPSSRSRSVSGPFRCCASSRLWKRRVPPATHPLYCGCRLLLKGTLRKRLHQGWKWQAPTREAGVEEENACLYPSVSLPSSPRQPANVRCV